MTVSMELSPRLEDFYFIDCDLTVAERHWMKSNEF